MLSIKTAIACATIISLITSTAFAAECACKQHDAKASGDTACSRTESSSFCTISYGSSAESRERIVGLLNDGVISGPTGGSQAMEQFIGSVIDPIDAAYRSLDVLGRIPSSIDAFRNTRNIALHFNTILMINFALSATLQEDTRADFTAAMTDFFKSDDASRNEDILNAFIGGNDTQIDFGNSELIVRLGCASLAYGQGKNTIVIASRDGVNNCEG